MLFNCLKCGKRISTSKSKCPYCAISTTEISEQIDGIHLKQKTKLKSQYKNSILSLVFKYKV